MAFNYGTHQLLDELKALDADNVFVSEYGEDDLFRHLQDYLDVHNTMVDEITGDFVEPTQRRIDRFGAGATSLQMVEVDEYGRADVQKAAVTGYDIGYPLRPYQIAVGWTKKYMDTHSPMDLAQTMIGALDADAKNIKYQILTALFRATNVTFIDRYVDMQDIPVKALINADSSAIPMDKYGNTFNGATHTHLTARVSTLAASDIVALINNVVEHDVNGGEVRLYINKAQLSSLQGFTTNFKEFQAPMLAPGGGSTADIVANGQKSSPYTIDDKEVGIWDGYVRVFIKPWVPASYMIALVVGDQSRGPVIRLRTRAGNSGYGNLRMVSQFEIYPLRAEHMEREFGVGVWNRLGAAVLYTGATTYAVPTLTQ